MNTLPPLKDLLFGFELEGVWPWADGVNERVKARSLFAPVLSTALRKPVEYHNSNKIWRPQTWVVTQDKTINAGWPLFLDVEIKSPVKTGTSLKKLPTELHAIAATGVETNESCGMHLHIGRVGQLSLPAYDRHTLWTPEQIICFMQSFQENAEAIYGLVAPNRRLSKHAMPNAVPDPERLAEIIAAYRADPASSDLLQLAMHNMYCPKDGEQSFRDYAVNLGSLLSTGTIEVRLRQADDYVNATPFVGVMLQMAQAAIDGRQFDWNDYAAAVANDPVLALPTVAMPSQPRPRPRFLPASAARPG